MLPSFAQVVSLRHLRVRVDSNHDSPFYGGPATLCVSEKIRVHLGCYYGRKVSLSDIRTHVV